MKVIGTPPPTIIVCSEPFLFLSFHRRCYPVSNDPTLSMLRYVTALERTSIQSFFGRPPHLFQPSSQQLRPTETPDKLKFRKQSFRPNAQGWNCPSIGQPPPTRAPLHLAAKPGVNILSPSLSLISLATHSPTFPSHIPSSFFLFSSAALRTVSFLKDRYPVPHLQDFTSGLQDAKIFSKIDLKKAYQVWNEHPFSFFGRLAFCRQSNGHVTHRIPAKKYPQVRDDLRASSREDVFLHLSLSLSPLSFFFFPSLF
ncbi:unnamed protein product [Acanthosepion pharaonis]|uniref:Reverse transcriptase domain-containing protein n=1 Tax=Acanthosepion pharaonis TaxID=158019 RepID=A0A812D2B1_ACAPH|nr:unnamed protein product [Sepia pharaonis]